MNRIKRTIITGTLCFITSLVCFTGSHGQTSTIQKIEILYQKLTTAALLENYEKVGQLYGELTSSSVQSEHIPQAALVYGQGLQKAQKYAQALSLYQSILRTFPQDVSVPELQLRIAHLYGHYVKDQFGYPEISKSFQAYRELNKFYPQSRQSIIGTLELIELYHYFGNREEAKQLAADFLKQHRELIGQGEYAEALYAIAFITQEEGKVAEAIQKYREIIATCPENSFAPKSYIQIARNYYFAGQYSNTLGTIQEAVDSYPNHPVLQGAEYHIQELKEKLNAREGSYVYNTTVQYLSNYCGPYALMELLKDYQVSANLKDLAVQTGYQPKKGVSLAGLLNALGNYHLVGQVTRTSYEALSEQGSPFIAVITDGKKNHYITVQKITSDGISYSDQMVNNRVLGKDSFLQKWTGISFTITTSLTRLPADRPLVPDQELKSIWAGIDDWTYICSNLSGPIAGPASSSPDGCNKTHPNINQYSTHGSAQMAPVGGPPKSGVGGGEITMVGDKRMGRSATSLAVNYGNGMAFTTFPDMSIPLIKGGRSITVTRTYSSQRKMGVADSDPIGAGSFGPDKPWGVKWNINFATHLWLAGIYIGMMKKEMYMHIVPMVMLDTIFLKVLMDIMLYLIGFILMIIIITCNGRMEQNTYLVPCLQLLMLVYPPLYSRKGKL